MKTLLLSMLFIVVLVSCNQLPVMVKDNHFRFENFKRNVDQPLEIVQLMCEHKKPIAWTEPKQFLSGEQNLWIQAIIWDKGNSYLAKEAVANFIITLNAGKSYMVNRKIQDENISLWIQEVKTGVVVSDVIIKKLTYPLFKGNLREKQCKTSTV